MSPPELPLARPSPVFRLSFEDSATRVGPHWFGPSPAPLPRCTPRSTLRFFARHAGLRSHGDLPSMLFGATPESSPWRLAFISLVWSSTPSRGLSHLPGHSWSHPEPEGSQRGDRRPQAANHPISRPHPNPGVRAPKAHSSPSRTSPTRSKERSHRGGSARCSKESFERSSSRRRSGTRETKVSHTP